MTHQTAPARRRLVYILAGLTLFAALCVVLIEVGKQMRANRKTAISYGGYNYNALPIDAVVINGEGGVLNVHPYSGGGASVCCVIVPSYWRPGLTAKIKWLSGADYERDANGEYVIRNRRKVYIEGTWKERTVEIPPYIGGDGPEMGDFYIFFLPNEEVAVLVSRWGAGHPAVPYPIPVDPRKQ